MRQGQQQQQNRRGRGRGGRKGQSPLSRSFESSGPDVKIRGTAQHIAEKYMALARDAIGSGDLVLGENYLQHAEHYNRIIMAAQVPTQSPYDGLNGNGQRVARPEGELLPGDNGNDGYDDDGDDGDQPGDNGQGYDAPRQFEPQNQREHQPPPRQREPRSFEPRPYDNRDNRPHEPRHHDNRGPDNRGQDNRGQDYRGPEPRGGTRVPEHRTQDQRSYEPRIEPRVQDQPRTPNGHGDQPRTFDPPRVGFEGGPGPDLRQPAETRPPNPAAPRGRRRRGRHENGTDRPFSVQPPQFGDAVSPAANDAPHEQPAAPAGHDTPGGNGGGDGGGSEQA